jgi:LPXTG-site transpeptidase (sortase) family protein
MKLNRVLQILSVLIIGAGLALIVPFGYFWLQNQSASAESSTVYVPSIAPEPPKTPDLITGKPAKLNIPSLKTSLKIADGVYNEQTGEWSLSTDKAHYALPTSQPNNKTGNTLIYGHYRWNVFASLHKIQPGAKVVVTTKNGYKFTYTFKSSEVVPPHDISIFEYQGKPRLTLQTCTGVYFENRQMFYFDFDKVEKI